MKKSDIPSKTTDTIWNSPLRWSGLSYGMLPATIMLLVIIACLIGYSLAMANLEALRSKTIEESLGETKLRFSSVFDSYAHLSWGSSGRMQSGSADETSWKNYISVSNISENFTGMEAIGVSNGSGPSDNTVAYADPMTDSVAETIGFNMGSVPELRATMDQAARAGQTVVTGVLPDFFSTRNADATGEKGFLMYTPYYEISLPIDTPEQRMSALRGFTVAMFRGDEFFGLMMKDDDLSHERREVYLGGVNPDNLLYKSGKTTDTDVRVVKQDINIYGKTFTVLHMLDTAHINAWMTSYFPQFILFGGLGFGVLFAGISGYMLRNRFFRLTYEKERDVEFAKDELLSLASHQLRTPATGVKQYLGMVLQGFAGDITSKQREYLQRAYASNNRQLGVINDILHLAKLETGRIVLAERKFDIAKMVRDVVDEQQDSAEKGGIRLVLEAPSTGSIMADSHMLRMVIENLLSNAIKYTPEGGTVSVRLARRGTKWIMMVRDTGVGIAKADFSKLFKQFTRISNPRTDIVTGTGVGLYLAYHLTVLHGGTISVASRKGKGSTFTVRLPRKI